MVVDFLLKRAIKIPLESTTKPGVLIELVDLLCDVYELDRKEEILTAILEREELMSTGVGYGIAIPHAKIDFITVSKLVGGVSPSGIDYDAVDGRLSQIFFLLVSPRNGSGDHVRILSSLSRTLHSQEVRDMVITAPSSEQLIRILREYDK